MGATERIREYLENKGITKYQFYKRTGFSNKFLDNSSNMGTDRAEIILHHYHDISPEWLLTGQGPMLRETKSAETQKNIIPKDSNNTDYQHKYNNKNAFSQEKQEQNLVPNGIPLIPVDAMAGYGKGDVQVMDYDIQENYLTTPELAGKGIKYLIRASGSSMTPKYNNGDLLACRPITDSSFIQWGKVYVLDTDQGAIVKRLYPCNPTDDDCLECRSDNYERYPPFKISKESIRRIAIVVAVLRLE